ncbi:MAG: ATP-binding protein [Xanthobacteraceae bacterium]
MGDAGTSLLWLRDKHLAQHALGPMPAWLWASDTSRVLWANATGAAIFGAATPAQLATRQFDAGQPAAAQVARLAETLSPDGAARLERLRGFGAGIGRALTCACSRITCADGTSGVLVAATERAGPELSLKERVTRLLSGVDQPLAAFTAEDALLHALPAARDYLGNATSLAALGARGQIAVDRVGSEKEFILIARFGDAVEPPVSPAAAAPVCEQTQAVQETAASIPAPQPTVAREPAPRAAPGAHRHPLRFLWQMDAEDRFTIDSSEFLALIGQRTAAALGRAWREIAAALGIDPEGQIAQAIATGDTWSGITVAWPVDDSAVPLPVELSGLPVFDRSRTYRGYRGFGVCRDVAQLNAIAEARVTETHRAQAAAPDSVGATGEPSTENVVPFRPLLSEPDIPTLSPLEHIAFHELSRRLSSHINGPEPTNEIGAAEPQPADPTAGTPEREDGVSRHARPFLDRLPFGVLIYRLSHLLYANRSFLEWTGYDSLDALAEDGGIDSLLVEPGAVAIETAGRTSFAIASQRSENAQAEGRLLLVPWEGESAFALLTIPRDEAATAAAANAALDGARAEMAELNAILDTATDGVIVVDGDVRILSSNRSAQALFGYDAHELAGRAFIELFAPESAEVASDYLDGLKSNTMASLLNDGREIIGRARQGGLIPLDVSMGRIGERGDKFCAVFRDVTPWKKAEEDLIAARRQAERASSAKSDFLAKVSHEVRTPLNAIIGFSEVMKEERFGPIGNDRYQQYLCDIHAAGEHLISLINDLLDLSKIEAGKLELSFDNLSVNDIILQCVAIMQPQANRERIIIRTSMPPKLPQIVADARSVRQIVLNLLSNSIKFTGAGGQVIVSGALTDLGDVVVRVRDSGIGMSEKDIATAMEPFRQVATSTRFGSGGTGLGLSLSKALAEANRAQFSISSRPQAGTLVEVTFPATRLAAAE